MKLLQLNIWGGRLGPQINKLIKDENPDILCLQEVVEVSGGRARFFTTAEEFQDTIGAAYRFMSPVFKFNYMNRKASFGNCIISKFPIIKSETIFTGNEFNDKFDNLTDSSNIRNLQHVVVELEDKSKLHVLNHHGHHNHQHKDGDAETMRQISIIANEIKKIAGRIILSGDFNLNPKSESLGLINSLLRNLSIEAKLKTTRTSLTHKKEVIDYILVSKDINVESFKAIDDVVSDHMALTLVFS